jgi:Uri superfamily endonuclease
MGPLKGTYALLMKSPSLASVQVGHWGELAIMTGYYIYVGSALGPGGLEARLSRHFRKDKNHHWHIDFLSGQLHPRWAWVSDEPVSLEHHWACTLGTATGFSPIRGFGCSDCRCHAHLFRTATRLAESDFSSLVGVKTYLWRPGEGLSSPVQSLSHQSLL